MNKCRLIWVTPDIEKIITYCARVSNPKNQDNENIEKLLKYCLDNGHVSIFEMGNMCLEINTSTAIATQILRHKSFSFQMYSQRYSEVQSIEDIECRRQDTKNRQNSIDDLPQETKDWWECAKKESFNLSLDLYKQALEKGIAKESARFLLPTASSTRMYMNGTIRSWIHYIQLRCGNGTQLEHKIIGDECKEIFKQQLPIISKSLGWI